VHVSDPTLVLDRKQFREVTLDDEELMREILSALIDDTSRQMKLLEVSVRDQDARQCGRLAHYSKGACANVGANAAAAVLGRIEQQAARGTVGDCGVQLAVLAGEIQRLRAERV
jgi:HPt (histidine-containing phosphotransfer) domain-containing protein